jgi:RNA polymerase sigma factor (sigma-70 family)
LSKEEAELINRCKQGDIKSYELLYNRYSRAMYHTCLRMVVNEADAEDILQDAFMEAFANLNRLKNIDAFAGWLKRTVINKALNQLKRNRKTWLEIDETVLDNLPEEEPIDEDIFKEKVEVITAALNLLPDKYRVVINLHVFETMSFEDIAIMLEIPSSTVRSQYLRGRQKILNSIAHKI